MRTNMETSIRERKNICNEIEAPELEMTNHILVMTPSALNDKTKQDTEIRREKNWEPLVDNIHDHETKETIVGKEINIAKSINTTKKQMFSNGRITR